MPYLSMPHADSHRRRHTPRCLTNGQQEAVPSAFDGAPMGAMIMANQARGTRLAAPREAYRMD
jgi:hypothetical protein